MGVLGVVGDVGAGTFPCIDGPDPGVCGPYPGVCGPYPCGGPNPGTCRPVPANSLDATKAAAWVVYTGM